MIKKIFNNPFFYFKYAIRISFTLIVFPVKILIFKKIGLLTYISPNSSIRNHGNIVLSNYCQINSFVVLWPTKLQIGQYSQINPGTAIYGNVAIGKNVMIAPNCMIAGGNHNFRNVEVSMIFQGSNEKGIVIEDDVWIGANSVIVDGVKIGRGAVIAAGSVVVRDVDEYSVVAGVPAVKIKSRL
jgi:acetyltransferase-like isoleucine patch superfamily enzyme